MNLEYIDTNSNKPIKKMKNEKIDISSFKDVSIVIPKGFVVVDFYSSNSDGFDNNYDNLISSILKSRNNSYTIGSDDIRIHMFYKIPNGLKIKAYNNVTTVGGFVANFGCEGGTCSIKINGKLLKHEKKISMDVLNETPELPDICYPLYGFKNPCLIGENCANKKHLIPKVAKHIKNIRKIYKNIDISNVIRFINMLLETSFEEDEEFIELVEKEMNIDFNKGLRELAVYKLSEIEEKEVNWLWYPFIPIGAITLIFGDGGLGKSFLTLLVSSILSRGGEFPYSDNGVNNYYTPTASLILNTEDSQTIIKKRIKLLNGDFNYIYVVDNSVFDFHIDNIDLLEDKIKELNLKLIIFDPLQQYLPTKINMNVASEIRNCLVPLSKLAEKYQCSFLLVMHKNKNINTQRQYRVIGSIDFFAISRSVISIDKENDTTYMTQIKNSFGQNSKRICIEISDSGISFKDDINVKEDKHDRYKEIKQQIKEALSDGKEVLSSEMEIIVKENRISNRMLGKIKTELGIKHKQKGKRFYWYIE